MIPMMMVVNGHFKEAWKCYHHCHLLPNTLLRYPKNDMVTLSIGDNPHYAITHDTSQQPLACETLEQKSYDFVVLGLLYSV